MSELLLWAYIEFRGYEYKVLWGLHRLLKGQRNVPILGLHKYLPRLKLNIHPYNKLSIVTKKYNIIRKGTPAAVKVGERTKILPIAGPSRKNDALCIWCKYAKEDANLQRCTSQRLSFVQFLNTSMKRTLTLKLYRKLLIFCWTKNITLNISWQPLHNQDTSHLGVCLGLGLPGWLLGPVARAHTMPGMRRNEEEGSYL